MQSSQSLGRAASWCLRLVMVLTVAFINHSPICSRPVPEQLINQHIDGGCRDAIPGPSTPKKMRMSSASESARPVAPIFKTKTGGPTRHDLSTSQQQQQQQPS